MLLAQLIINGLATGAVYSLMALGFAVIYNNTHIFHVAHGGVFTFAAYIFYLFMVPLQAGYALAFLAAVLGSTILGIAMELGVYRPIRRRTGTRAAVLIASIGMLTVLQSVFALIFSTDTRSPGSGTLPTAQVGGFTLSVLYLIAAAFVLILFPLLQLFLLRSKYGKAIRALADNGRLAVVLGFDVDRLYVIIFGIGSALAGVAATLIAVDFGAYPYMGFTTVFVAIVAVIIGGVGSLAGAVLGAAVLGVLASLAIWQLNSAWQDAVVFAVLLVFLLIRPQGLFGASLNVRRA